MGIRCQSRHPITLFSFGNMMPDSLSLDYAWFATNAEYKTQPVGQKKAQCNGDSYDMHGNVYEWVKDHYGPTPHHQSTDPPGRCRK